LCQFEAEKCELGAQKTDLKAERGGGGVLERPQAMIAIANVQRMCSNYFAWRFSFDKNEYERFFRGAFDEINS
jgi:hypothetical protein